MTKPNLTFVTDEKGEWEVLYVNGVRYEEGHQIRVEDLIDFMLEYDLIEGVDYKKINNDKYDYEDAEGEPEFHTELSDYAPDDFARP